MAETRWLAVGLVLKPKGLKGEVKVSPSVSSLEIFDTLETVRFEKNGEVRTLTVESVADNRKFVYLKFAEVNSIEEAELLREGILQTEAEALGPLAADSWYQSDLIGCQVRLSNGVAVGEVRDVITYPSCDCLEIVRPGGREVSVPLLKTMLASVDIGKREIVLVADQAEELL